MRKQTTTMTAKNKAFWAKPKAEQCVTVAKDVIKQLEAKFFVAKRGDYLIFDKLKKSINTSTQLDALFSKVKSTNGKCEVCGIGSCFVSLVGLGNNFKSDKLFGETIENGEHSWDVNMRPLLRKVFSPRQLSMIESAFEQSSYMDNKDKYSDIFESNMMDAIDFGNKYASSHRRLKAIMQNVIKNKGTFKP